MTGSELPVDSQLSLVWDTVDCQWLLAGASNEQYRGRTCTPRSVQFDTLTTGADGALHGNFTVPEDFGFAHNVSVVDSAGVVRNRALFDVAMQVSVTPTDGPVGTPITIEVKGMGVQTLEDTRAILYDNQYTGFLSAVTTRGTAQATIPATGKPGSTTSSTSTGARIPSRTSTRLSHPVRTFPFSTGRSA